MAHEIEQERGPSYVSEILGCSIKRARDLMKTGKIRSFSRHSEELDKAASGEQTNMRPARGKYQILFTYDSQIAKYQDSLRNQITNSSPVKDSPGRTGSGHAASGKGKLNSGSGKSGMSSYSGSGCIREALNLRSASQRTGSSPR